MEIFSSLLAFLSAISFYDMPTMQHENIDPVDCMVSYSCDDSDEDDDSGDSDEDLIQLACGIREKNDTPGDRDIKAMKRACKRSDLAEVKRLLNKNPCLVYGTKDSIGPLNGLCGTDKANQDTCAIIEELIHVGVSPSKETIYEWTPLLRVIYNAKAGEFKPLMIETLLANGADPNVKGGFKRATFNPIPLSAAIDRNELALVTALIAGGARVNVHDKVEAKCWPQDSKELLQRFENADELCAKKWPQFVSARLSEHERDALVPNGKPIHERQTIRVLSATFQEVLDRLPRGLCNTIAEMRRALITQGASRRRQLVVIDRLLDCDGMLHPKPNMLGYIQSFLPGSDIVMVIQNFSCGLALSGSRLEALS